MAHKYVDLSSDDDFGSSAKKKAFKRRSIGGPINREYFMNDILGYTDEELFQNLKRYGFDCGPVSGSTRKVYQKKLAEKMVEGPPPPPPKTGRRSMGPTFRSLPTRLPDPDLEDDFISGSSGSDIEVDEVDGIIPRKPVPVSLGRDRQKPSDSNHKGSGSYAKKHPPRIDPPPESLLPTIQLRRLDREDRATPPPPEEDASKYPHKIQPMHREKVKPKPKPHTSKEGSHKEDVSIWVQVIILLICLLVTIFFLKYIDSTETLPKAPDLTDTPPITPDILDQYQPEPPQNQTDTPSKESTSTPSKESPSTPSKESTGTPSKESPSTPSKESTGTPSKESTGTPSKESPSTPSKESTGTPSKESPSTPSKESTGTPSKESPSTPSKESPGTPSKESPSTPSKESPSTPSKEPTSTLDGVGPPSPKENEGRSPPVDPVTGNNTPSNQSPDNTPPPDPQSANVEETDRAAQPPKDSVKGKEKAKKKKPKGAASESNPNVR